ncbi:MAG: sporulation membrane protein YtrI [Anaerobacillus sp.]|uniref:sporulation membrane protein YtrI n=1 Tax=Anaerobacillus sp. TaxID=1872506 RepID=UPI00391952F2
MMRIPPYYRQAGWQRFFSGIIIGMIIGWFFFIYQFGSIQEKLVTEIKMQQAIIKDQKRDIEVLRSDKDELNKENQKKLTVQEVKVYFKNDKELKLSELSLYELRSQIENELTPVKNKNIEAVANARELLYQTIQNKTYTVNEKRYHVIVKELHLYTTLEIFVEIRLAD